MSYTSMSDASFLYMETDKVPTHAATLQVFEVPEGKHDTYVEELRRFMYDRRFLVPYLTNRLCFVPGNIDHPEWVDEATFDPEYHVQSVDLGGNATERDMEEAVAEIHEQRMPLDRPMWRIVVIMGLEGGRVAHYSSVHHVCVDGMGGQHPLNALADTSPETTWYHPEEREPEKQPSPTSLYLRALERLAKANLEQLRGATKGMQTAGNLMSRAISPTKSFGALTQGAPKTSFNVEIDEKRSFAVGKMPLAEVKAMSRELDCTVNDVFMAIAADGLRRFFLRRDELPDKPLIAGCPVSVRSEGDLSQNNQVAMMMVSLETHIEDPVTRLKGIRESAQIGKEVSAELFGADAPEMRVFGLPGLFSNSVRLAESMRLATRGPSIMNITISNIPGPKDVLYSNGAEMVAMYPVSLPLHGTGVNLTVISYRGTMDFSITAAKCALEEPQELRDDLLNAFADLRDLVLGKSKTGKKSTTKKPKKPRQSAKSKATKATVATAERKKATG